MLSFLLTNIYMEPDKVVHTAKYIPVAVPTYALVPIMTSTGQNIDPGPRPHKEQPIAPKNAMIPNEITFLFVASKSPFANL